MEKELVILSRIFIIFAIVFFWLDILSFEIFTQNMYIILINVLYAIENVVMFLCSLIVWVITLFMNLSMDRKIICIQNMIIVYFLQKSNKINT